MGQLFDYQAIGSCPFFNVRIFKINISERSEWKHLKIRD